MRLALLDTKCATRIWPINIVLRCCLVITIKPKGIYPTWTKLNLRPALQQFAYSVENRLL